MPPSPELFSDTVAQYLEEIGRYELLTAEDEVELAQQMEAGRRAAADLEQLVQQNGHASLEEKETLAKIALNGDAAKEKFINSNLRLVISVVKRHHQSESPTLSFMDSVQAGNQGLIRAVEKFNWRKGFKFSTYGTWWIRQAITREYGNSGRTIRYPVYMAEEAKLVKKSMQILAQANQTNPTPEQIAEHAGFEVDQVNNILGHLSRTGEVVALETAVGEDGSTLGDFIKDEGVDVESQVMRNIISSELINSISQLEDRDRDILELRYGLRDGVIHTLDEIGNKYKVSRERVRQIERNALSKLKKNKEIRKLAGLAEESEEELQDTA